MISNIRYQGYQQLLAELSLRSGFTDGDKLQSILTADFSKLGEVVKGGKG